MLQDAIQKQTDTNAILTFSGRITYPIKSSNDGVEKEVCRHSEEDGKYMSIHHVYPPAAGIKTFLLQRRDGKYITKADLIFSQPWLIVHDDVEWWGGLAEGVP